MCRLAPSRFTLAIVLVLVVVGGAAARVADVDRSSSWRDRDIRIDGSDDDWKDLPLPVKGERFALGIANDGEFLYLCLPTKDAGTRTQIAQLGLVVWIDKAGGKKEQFGIHFPLGLRQDDRRGRAGTGRRPDGRRAGEPEDAGVDAGPDQHAVGILGRGGRDAEVVPLFQAGGLEARVGLHDDLLVYELKVPLRKGPDHPFAPGLAPGDVARLQIETAAVRGPVAPLGIPGGGVIVGGGRGGGIAIGGALPRMDKPIRTTMNVKLAAGPI